MQKFLLLSVFLCCNHLVIFSQVNLTVRINSGNCSATTCTDPFGGAVERQWSIRVNSGAYTTYPAAGICFTNPPFTQFNQNYNCAQNYPATLNICLQAFEDDGSACIVSQSCLVQACGNFATPAPGGSFTYNLNVGGGSTGTVNFTIKATGNFLNSASSYSVATCAGYFFGSQTYTNSGVYNKTLTNVFGCDSIVTVNLTINPSAVVSAVNGTICAGSSFTLNPSGADTYIYSSGSNIVSPTGNTTYTITGTNTLTSCSAPVTCSVQVNALPTLTANATDDIVFYGTPTTLFAGGASTYTWSGGVVDGIPFTPTITTTYTLTGIDANGCATTFLKTITVTSTLSVELLFFNITINDKNVDLDWSTLSEKNNAYIKLYRSKDGLIWEQIAKMKGVGNSLNPSLYYYKDVNASEVVNGNGLLYYRLDQSDYNGLTTQSEIKSITFEDLSSKILIYTNPTKGFFTLELKSPAKVIITNASGQIILTEALNSGRNILDIQNQATGTYFVNTVSDKEKHCFKLIKE